MSLVNTNDVVIENFKPTADSTQLLTVDYDLSINIVLASCSKECGEICPAKLINGI